jgi:YfiR/HmsC-like
VAILNTCARPEFARARVSLTRWVSGAVLALVTTAPSVSAPSYSEDSVKAAYLYRFTQYVEWPQSGAPQIPFTIAVFDAPGVAAELRKILPNHRIKDSAAQVREVTRLQDLGAAQMVYVGPTPADRRDIIAALSAKPVLVVTDADQGLVMGSVLNFVMQNNRVRFEVSLIAADRSGLRISAELLGVATRVQTSDHTTGIAKAKSDAAGE